MLCTKCSPLPELIRSSNTRDIVKIDILHQPTFAELDESARSGCELCALFRGCLREKHAANRSCSLEEAEGLCRRGDLNREDTEDSKLLPAFSLVLEVSRCHTVLDGIEKIFFCEVKMQDGEDPQCYLDVCSLPRSDALRRGHLAGRLVPPEVDFELAKEWLAECSEKHTACSQPSGGNAQLPARILHLQAFQDGTGDIRLVPGTGIGARYATLSYCWGKSQPLRLTSMNETELTERIAFGRLPKTFQDAVTATRSLGLAYLWIDSLCITQDSLAEWEEQCSQMSNIYSNSFVTIAGPAASDCHTGFLQPRPTRDQAVLDWPGADGHIEKVIVSALSCHPFSFTPEQHSPLATRAWVLQERLLSPRTLYFGSRAMYMECFTNVRVERCHYPVRESAISLDLVKKTKFGELPESHRFTHWRKLASTYSSLSLTKPTDRLPALWGLAAAFQRATGAHYAAGIWKEDLLRGLMWYISHWRGGPLWRDGSTSARPDYPAPSWSWASRHDIDFLSIPYQFLSEPHSEPHGGLKVLGVEVTPRGHDPMDEAQGGYIKVRGKMRSAALDLTDDSPYRRCYRMAGNTEHIYFPDDVPLRATVTTKHEVLLLYLGSWRSDSVSSSAALALEAVGRDCDLYRRVGIVQGHFWNHNKSWDYFEDALETTLRII